MIVYIINRRVTRNNLDDRYNFSYYMGYAYTTTCIIYWNPYQHFYIHVCKFWVTFGTLLKKVEVVILVPFCLLCN